MHLSPQGFLQKYKSFSVTIPHKQKWKDKSYKDKENTPGQLIIEQEEKANMTCKSNKERFFNNAPYPSGTLYSSSHPHILYPVGFP